MWHLSSGTKINATEFTSVVSAPLETIPYLATKRAFVPLASRTRIGKWGFAFFNSWYEDSTNSLRHSNEGKSDDS